MAREFMDIEKTGPGEFSIKLTRNEAFLIRQILSGALYQRSVTTDSRVTWFTRDTLKELVSRFKNLYPSLPGLGPRRRETNQEVLDELRRKADEIKEITLTFDEMKIISLSARFLMDDEITALDWDSIVGYSREAVEELASQIEGSVSL